MSRPLPYKKNPLEYKRVLARAKRGLFLSLLLILLSSCMTVKGLEVDFSDSRLAQGELALVHLKGPVSGTSISGKFKGGETIIVKSKKGRGAWAIVAADLESEPGPYYIIFKKGEKKISTSLRIVSGEFGTDRITLPREMVTFDKKTLARIKREKETLKAALAVSSKKRLWSGPFIMPLKGRISGAFGQRRILNGSPRSPHSGLDIAAPAGTPIVAAGRGRVAFVGKFFFYGNFVVLDHGLGLSTLYAHMSSTLVKKGELVKVGQPIGRVGATGRATGPHLHFAVRVGKARVSPRGFIGLTKRLAGLMSGTSSLKRGRDKGPLSQTPAGAKKNRPQG